MATEDPMELDAHGGLAYWSLCDGRLGFWDRGDGIAEIHDRKNALTPIRFIRRLLPPASEQDLPVSALPGMAELSHTEAATRIASVLDLECALIERGL